MIRLATPLSLAVIAVLGACAAPPQQGGPAFPKPVVTNVHPYYPGTGVVQSVMPAPAMAASAGSSAEPMQRLEIKMDNGVIQYVDTASRDFRRGTRVRLTEDKVLSRV